MVENAWSNLLGNLPLNNTVTSVIYCEQVDRLAKQLNANKKWLHIQPTLQIFVQETSI